MVDTPESVRLHLVVHLQIATLISHLHHTFPNSLPLQILQFCGLQQKQLIPTVLENLG